MNPSSHIHCPNFPCLDVNHPGFQVPGIELDPAKIRVVMISEAAPVQPADYFYAPGEPLFLQTTLLALNDAGFAVRSIQDILDLGVYLTTAVKCSKTGYAIQTGTVSTCSYLLEAEIALFPAVQAYLLMGDVAIKAVNAISRREGGGRVIPAGSTYKIRGGKFTFRGKPAFPSYLQAGPSFFIEKSKRRMIAEDIVRAMASLD